MPKKLWKTTIVIWSDKDLSHLETEDIAREATSGCAYCSHQITEVVKDPSSDPSWDGTEFFHSNEEEEE